jgi:hypothetical protein
MNVGEVGEGEQETRSRFVIANTLDGVASVENAQVQLPCRPIVSIRINRFVTSFNEIHLE